MRVFSRLTAATSVRRGACCLHTHLGAIRPERKSAADLS